MNFNEILIGYRYGFLLITSNMLIISGNDSAFLFTLRPKMRCFPTSGYNDHYQYLNLHQQTMPNGLVRRTYSDECSWNLSNFHKKFVILGNGWPI